MASMAAGAAARDAAPAPEDLSNRAPSSAATRGRYGRPATAAHTQQALVHMQFWFGGSEGVVLRERSPEVEIGIFQTLGSSVPLTVSVRRHATAAKRTVVFAARRADLREAGEASVVEASDVGAVSGETTEPPTSPTRPPQRVAPMQRARQQALQRAVRAARRWRRRGDRGDLAAALHVPLHAPAATQHVPSSAKRSPKAEREQLRHGRSAREGPLGPAAKAEARARGAGGAAGEDRANGHHVLVRSGAAPRCEARCRRALRRRRWRRRQGRCRWASSCAWVRRHRSRRQRADGAARGRPCTPVARRAAPHSR